MKKQTKTIILNTSLELFAKKGIDAVSLRDIAEVVGIKMSSIYYYYDSKNKLLKDIFDNYIEDIEQSFKSLSMRNRNAETPEDVIRNIFDERNLSFNHNEGCFGMALAVREQHNNEYARRCVFEVFYGFCVRSLETDFNRLIEEELIPPCFTRGIAMMLMLCLIEINEMKVHQLMGAEQPIECNELYDYLKHQTAFLLKNGYLSWRKPVE